jgi:hypothetical protein
MRKERGESIVETCEGDVRENEMFYNLIMHRGVYTVDAF